MKFLSKRLRIHPLLNNYYDMRVFGFKNRIENRGLGAICLDMLFTSALLFLTIRPGGDLFAIPLHSGLEMGLNFLKSNARNL